MTNKGAKKYFKNPTIGVLPFIVFIISFLATLEIERSSIIGMLSALFFELCCRIYGKSKISTMALGTSFSALLLTLITHIIFGNVIFSKGLFLVLGEIYFVCIVMVVRLFQPQIKQSFFWHKHYTQKVYLNDFFETAALIQYLLSVHLFYMLIYVYLRHKTTNYTILDGVSYIWIPLSLCAGLFLYGHIKIWNVSRKLRKEEWLPIVNEKGEVSGKIAKMESLKLKNRFMHPYIRIAVVCNERIYLKPRQEKNIIDIGALDHPFENNLLFSHDVNISARDSIAHILEKSDESTFKFLLKYSFKNEETNRLIFLYLLRVKDESLLRELNIGGGKFWSLKQVDENMLQDDIFGECFQLEYEYLKNTIFIAEKVKNATKNS